MAKQKLGPLQRDWIQRLRSGDYKQGTGRLCRINGEEKTYCCLGVACLTACQETGLTFMKSEDGLSLMFNGSSAVLPSAVMDAMKFKTRYGGTSEFFRCLASMNDNGSTFNAIADAVEANPERYFTGAA